MTKLVAEDAAFEAWWDMVNRIDFAKAHGADEPYRPTWGSGYKMTSRVAWFARAAHPEPSADARDADRYRWLRDDNAYVPEEEGVRGGEQLDKLCDDQRAAPCST